jgi:pimeloyl-ACP methyl ester carboxylesterase
MKEPRARFYQSQRLKLHYAEWGDPGGKPLMLVHGGFDHARSWDWVADALGDGYHIVAPDLRGHGDSAWVPGSSYPATDSVYDLFRLFAHLGWKRAPVIAHSLGGIISLQLAGAFPDLVERLLLIEGWRFTQPREFLGQGPAVETRLRRWVGAVDALENRHPRHYPTLEEAIARMREANPRLTPDQAHHLTAHGSRRNDDGTYSWKYDNHVRTMAPYRFDASDHERLWTHVTCPVLLVSGSEGFASDPAEVIKCIPTARAMEFERAAHWVHHDRLDDFVALARDFLK